MGALLPHLPIDCRAPFEDHCNISDYERLRESSRIRDVRQPFEKQPTAENDPRLLYDGFVLQDLLRTHIPEAERDIRSLHIILTDLLVCTFDEDDWKYHARPIVCGTPTLLSLSGIVEGPARPREYYMAGMHGLKNHSQLEKEFAGRFIGYGDDRLYAAALNYSMQSLFYFITEGRPFCSDPRCRLYNAHWQEELISFQLKEPKLCEAHLYTLNKFNSTQREN